MVYWWKCKRIIKKPWGCRGFFCCNALVIYIYFAILMLDRRCGNGKGKSYIKDGQ